MLFVQGGVVSQEEDGGIFKTATTGDRWQPKGTIGLDQDEQSYLLVYSFMVVLIQQILYPFYTDLFTTHSNENYCIRYTGSLVLVAFEVQARSFWTPKRNPMVLCTLLYA